MRLPSSSQHTFSQVPVAEIPRSRFDRSHEYKTTFDSGWLVPVFIDEVLPGDTFNLQMAAFARLATPLHPFMHNMYLDSFFFFVPNRLIWNNWQRFNGEQPNPDDTTDFLVPIMVSPSPDGYPYGEISDYFGLPTGIEGYEHISLFHRAYNLIYNEWFRDQNLQDAAVVDLDDGPDDPGDYFIRRRGKRHDYFTSCLPWPQKGPAVDLPLGADAPVLGIGPMVTIGAAGAITINETGKSPTGTAVTGWQVEGASGTVQAGESHLGVEQGTGNFPNIRADLSNATAATINQLRQAFQIQKLYERDARGGTRYTEIIRAHFGVVSPDARLQRPEYLGGGSAPIHLNPVAQTSESATTPQANLSAIGTVSVRNHGFTKSFTEHGVVIGIVSVRADLVYQQGLNRMFSRQIRWDYYWPALSHIGEQAVLNKEIFLQATGMDDNVFGYQERYAEYRYKPSMVTGKFRSSDPQSLDVWHLAQDFASLPVLNDEFIVEDPPVTRVIAVSTEPHFLFDSYFTYSCARPMPVYSVPGLIDHF